MRQCVCILQRPLFLGFSWTALPIFEPPYLRSGAFHNFPDTSEITSEILPLSGLHLPFCHLLRFLVTLDRNKKNCSIQNNVSLNNIVIYSKETVIMLDKVGVYLKAMVEEKTIIEKFTTKNYFNDNYN